MLLPPIQNRVSSCNTGMARPRKSGSYAGVTRARRIQMRLAAAVNAGPKISSAAARRTRMKRCCRTA